MPLFLALILCLSPGGLVTDEPPAEVTPTIGGYWRPRPNFEVITEVDYP
ncbi:MAG: hypothetical protein FWG11_00985 [Promicromonosporaceae bacterium]|nr:hypothetical protein [Promicromonosporaceae bacterium]